MITSLSRCCCMLVLTAIGWSWTVPANADPGICTASMTTLAFGNVNPQSSRTTANATLSYTCNAASEANQYLTLCFEIGVGPHDDDAQANPRRMQGSLDHDLQFQLYQDPALANPWGSFSSTFGSAVMVNVLVPGGGSSSGTVTLYGQVLGGQTSVPPGTYQESMGTTIFTVKDGGTQFPADCSSGNSAGSFPFTVSATVADACTVTATTLNFDGSGLLTSGASGTSTLSVQCASGSAYNIGLDAGLNGNDSIDTRKMALGGRSIGYQLYSDLARTMVWGSAIGANTVTGSGNGLEQQYTVYGSVPAQATPPAGTYEDTITVTVTY